LKRLRAYTGPDIGASRVSGHLSAISIIAVTQMLERAGYKIGGHGLTVNGMLLKSHAPFQRRIVDGYDIASRALGAE